MLVGNMTIDDLIQTRVQNLGIWLVRARSTLAKTTCWNLHEIKLLGSNKTEAPPRVAYQVLDDRGLPLQGIDVILGWDDWYIIQATDKDGMATIPLYHRYDPNMEAGPCWAAVVNTPSDEVHGIGVPLGQPVVIELVFQRQTP